MEEKRTWLEYGLQFFKTSSSPKKEGSDCKSKSESDTKQNRANDGLFWDKGYHEEIMNLHVTHLEEEIIKLKDQVEKSENKVGGLSGELKLKEEELRNLKEFSEKQIYKLKVGLAVVGCFCCFCCVFFPSDLLLILYSLCLFLGFLFIFSEKLKSKEEELHNLKEFSDKEIYKLKAQIEESEARLNIQISKHVNEITNLVEQLEIANEKLMKSEDENAGLRKELESMSCENQELQGELIEARKEVESKSCENQEFQSELIEAEENMTESDLELVSRRKHIQILENLVMIYEQEVQKLKSKMLDSQEKFSLEKDELHFDIASLLKTKKELTSTLADCEFKKTELESKLRQYEAEKLKQEEQHATQEELGQREGDLEAVTKELNMVTTERDEANFKINRLLAEICTLNFQMNMNM